MDVPANLCLGIVFILSAVQISNTSVNTSRNPTTKKTNQSSNYSSIHTSDKVVDGCRNQTHASNCCSHTLGAANMLEAWWQVDLGDQIVIEYVHIFYRNESLQQKRRFAGFQIYLSNTTTSMNGTNCYSDKTSNLNDTNLQPTIRSCKGTTRYLTIYVNRRTRPHTWYSESAILELCEVEVYGCPLGKYGQTNCDSSCDTTCVNNLCHPTSGQCANCAVGYYKSGTVCKPCQNCLNDVCDTETGICEVCANGFHSFLCTLTCPDNCKDRICDRNSGECIDCAVGYYRSGTVCKPCQNCLNDVCYTETGICEVCANGFHSFLCTLTCPDNCKDRICDRNSGECIDCNDGFFGRLCIACSANCLDSVCNQTSGNCSPCNNGYYGLRCNQTCSMNCANKTCNQTNGECLGCDSGYYGNTCNQSCPTTCKDKTCGRKTGKCEECEPGHYGDKCEKNCTSHCLHNVCNQTSGHCRDCVAGYYTAACNQSCPPNCKQSKCDRFSGDCSECALGYFTTECNQSCPINCRETRCDRNSGECSACTSGYFGMKCQEICGHCRNSSCSMSNGTCECSDGWEGGTCVTRKSMLSASEDKTGMYAGAGVGAVVGVVLLVITSIVILRRKQLSSNKESQSAKNNNMSAIYSNISPSPPTSQRTIENDQSSKETKGAEAAVSESGLVYVNMHDLSLTAEEDDVKYSNSEAIATPIHELRSIIDKKMANKATAFQEEFKKFPWGAVLPHEVGKNPSNKPRNRFKTTFPYDHSRIILERTENDNNTNYINANYIDSVEKRKVYIASQGPKSNTVDDFWRMVWQVSSGKIVMLTNLIEGGINKCYKYWPDEDEPLCTSTFHLTLDREMTYAFYVIRDILVVQRKTKAERQVQQFHFTTWPDHGIPDTLELALFHLRVTSYVTQLTGQMVVHCSAGLGRTGTFIALDALLTHGKTTGRVDIPRYVTTMRKDRMNMIQTYEQYIALHELLVEGFNLQESHISRAEFPAVLATMSPANKPANQTKIYQEFKALRDFRQTYTPSCFTAAMLKVNKDKNRNMNILPADQFRVFLQSQPASRTDYINAIMMQSYTSKSGYIVTQFPLEDTLGDFWTMIFDYSCESIVVLGQSTEVGWLEEDESTISADFSFKKLNERFNNADLTTADYQVTEERNSRETTVRIFTLTTWSSNSLLPPSDSSLLLLLEHVDRRPRSDNTKPVVVMCRDGCTQSGLFCCISNIRDQMKMDEEVDIFQTARQIKRRRPEALEDVKQYQYCYNILGQYLDSTDVYVN